MSTDWLLTVPDFVNSDGIKVSGTGPGQFNKIFKENGLSGPGLGNWSNIVSISRGGVDLGTVDYVKSTAVKGKKVGNK